MIKLIEFADRHDKLSIPWPTHFGGCVSATTTPAVFDGHNDVLLKLFSGGRSVGGESSLRVRRSALMRTKARAGGFGGGFFAVYVPSPVDLEVKFEEMTKPHMTCRCPIPLTGEDAMPWSWRKPRSCSNWSDGALRVCRKCAESARAGRAATSPRSFISRGPRRLIPTSTRSKCCIRRAALYRAGLEPSDDLWRGRAVPLS